MQASGKLNQQKIQPFHQKFGLGNKEMKIIIFPSTVLESIKFQQKPGAFYVQEENDKNMDG